MSAPEQPDEGRGPVENLLASPELAQAVQRPDYKRFLDHLPIALAVSQPVGSALQIAYWNPAFEMMIGAPAAGQDWSILDQFARDDGMLLGKAVTEGDDFVGV